jgi:hypothetical protein
MVIADYIRDTYNDPWQWGETDCGLWAAGWVASVTGVDPCAAYRGTYDTPFGCRRLVQRNGGMLTLTRAVMATFERGDGDGVAITKIDGRVICGLMSGGRLWVKGDGKNLSPAQYYILDRWVL